MLRGSSESSGMSSDEEEHIDKEMSSPTNFPTSPTSPISPSSPSRPESHRHGSLHNILWGSGENQKEKKKEKKREKRKKQKWIFVADVRGYFISINLLCWAHCEL